MKRSVSPLIIAAVVGGFASVAYAQTKPPHPGAAKDTTLQNRAVTVQPGKSHDGGTHEGRPRGVATDTGNATPGGKSTHSPKN